MNTYLTFSEQEINIFKSMIGKHSLTLCHYPMMSWKHQMRSYMIHGLIHANTDMDFWPCIKTRDNLLNAGVDINGFTPVTFDELMENNRRFKETH